MHDVEYHTVCYLRDLLVTPAHRDPEVTTFLTLWNVEEYCPRRGHRRRAGRPRRAGGPDRVSAPASGWLASIASRPWRTRWLDRRRLGVDRGPHDVGCGQRVDGAGGVRPARPDRRPPDPDRPAGAASCARRGATPTSTPARPSGACVTTPGPLAHPHRAPPLVGAGRLHPAAPPRGDLPGQPPVHRRRGPRHDPAHRPPPRPAAGAEWPRPHDRRGAAPDRGLRWSAGRCSVPVRCSSC